MSKAKETEGSALSPLCAHGFTVALKILFYFAVFSSYAGPVTWVHVRSEPASVRLLCLRNVGSVETPEDFRSIKLNKLLFGR